MNYSLKVRKVIEIKASVSHVWNTLISNNKLSQCLKMSVKCDSWEKGQSIYFRGFSNNSVFNDKAIITKFQKNRLLSYNYYKSNSERFTELNFFIKQTSKNVSELILIGKGFLNKSDQTHAEDTWFEILQKLKIEIEKTSQKY